MAPGLFAIIAVIVAMATRVAPTLAAQGAAQSARFELAGVTHPFKGTPGVYESTYQAIRGTSPFDRIALHRVTTGPEAPAHPELVVLYLPGTNMNGEVAIDDPRYSLPLYMAARGVDFWALDYRTHFVPPTTPIDDLGELKGWSNELFESDIDAAARFVMAATAQRKIVIAGFSRGVSFAYLYAAMHPENVAGLMLFDGWIPHHQAAEPPGRIVDDIGGKHLTYDKRKQLLELVIRDPNAPAPLPKYKSAAENLEHVVYDSAGFGGRGGLANPFGGFSNPVVLAHELITYDRYWPAVQDYEGSFTPPLLASLKNSKIPVLAFSSTNISAQWPEQVEQSAHATGSSDVSVKTLTGWGHLDVICGIHAESRVFAPALAWLRRHRKQADSRVSPDRLDSRRAA